MLALFDRTIRFSLLTLLGVCSSSAIAEAGGDQIVHDAEYYILEAQNGDRWDAEDQGLQQRLAELREKYKAPPNIVHIMWDDTAYGDIGIPAIQKVRGFETPNLNQMAREGIMFTRFYTEVGCTPSRAACMTGRHPVRNGMYNIGMLRESHGLRDTEVTIAEVLSDVGYATAFHGKWHLGDIEESSAYLADVIVSLSTAVLKGPRSGFLSVSRDRDPATGARSPDVQLMPA